MASQAKGQDAETMRPVTGLGCETVTLAIRWVQDGGSHHMCAEVDVRCGRGSFS